MPLVDELATALVVEIKNVLGPTVDRLKTLEAAVSRLQAVDAELLVTRELSPMRERVAALEARPPVQGPPGVDGAPGKDGAPGPQGDPGMRYRGLFKDGERYELGDVVSLRGAWHCNEATTERPGGSSLVWTLMVMPGRDAKGAR